MALRRYQKVLLGVFLLTAGFSLSVWLLPDHPWRRLGAIPAPTYEPKVVVPDGRHWWENAADENP